MEAGFDDILPRLGSRFRVVDECFKLKPRTDDPLRYFQYGTWRLERQPLSYVRDYGDGKVLYTALGHDDRTFQHPDFQDLMIKALRYVSNLKDGKEIRAGLVGYGPLGLLLRELPVVDGRYRVDFAVVDPSAGTFVAIECDGYEFHERTKEQVQRDKARDRALTAAGWRVLRFTGSEVWSDPAACVREIVAMLLPDSKQRVG